MASIERRGNRQWRAKVRRKGYPEQTRTFDTKAQAEAWARVVESEMDRGIFVDRTEAERTTLHEALERYLREVTPHKKGAKQEATRIKALLQRPLTQFFLANIRGADIAAYRDARAQEGVGANTIRLELALISHVYTVACRDWGMESLRNPVESVRKPKLPKGRERRLLPGECGRLLGAAPLPLGEVIAFAVETAMRRGEIAQLRWRDVDLKNRSLVVREAKNSHARTVPLSPGALEILRALPRRLDGSVFGMSENAITLAYRRAVAAAGLQDLTFHDLRHEAASRLFEHTDLDLMEIRAITGHKSLQMLARYTHLRTARLADRLAGQKRVSE